MNQSVRPPESAGPARGAQDQSPVSLESLAARVMLLEGIPDPAIRSAFDQALTKVREGLEELEATGPLSSAGRAKSGFHRWAPALCFGFTAIVFSLGVLFPPRWARSAPVATVAAAGPGVPQPGATPAIDMGIARAAPPAESVFPGAKRVPNQ